MATGTKGLKAIYRNNLIPYTESMADIQVEIDFPALGLHIGNEQLVDGAFGLEEALCSESRLTFGCCEAAKLCFTVAGVKEELKGQRFTVMQTVNGEYVLQLGTYTVDSAPRQDGLWFKEVTAYDDMLRFDVDVSEWYRTLTFPVSMKEFREALLGYVGIEVETAELVNDGMLVERTIEPSELSGRTVIRAVCEINGCFGHIGRDGRFRYVRIGGTEEAEEFHGYGEYGAEKSIYETLEHEEFAVRPITGLQVRQDDDDVGCKVGMDGNTYIVEGNFLIYGKSEKELQDIAKRLLGVIGGVSYRPFEAKVLGNPCIEVGDAVKFKVEDELVCSYVLERTLSGIQILEDIYKAEGQEFYDGQINSPERELLQLKGKTNKLTRTVDETVSKITDLEEQTETKFRQTAKEIALEAKRAIDAEVELAGALTVAIGEIDLRVTYGDIINAINLSPEQVKIDANKLNVEAPEIDLSGYVTITSLADPDSTTVINGNLIRTGVIMSENYLDGDGRETGEGTLLNLVSGYMVFRGSYLYAWLDRPVEEHDAEVGMTAGRMRIRDKTRGEALYYSHEGISTTEDANRATGVLDFRSGIYGGNLSGEQYQGVTVQTQGSPVALRALANQVIIQPNVRQAVNNPGDDPGDYTSDMFTFGMERRYRVDENGGVVYSDRVANGDGLLWYGSRLPRGTGGWEQYVCLQFSADGGMPYTATLSGDRGQLAPHYASNMYKPVKHIKLTKDADGRITAMRVTLDAFISDEVVDVAVTYDADGNITGIGDTVVS